jgi:hypothetical protein
MKQRILRLFLAGTLLLYSTSGFSINYTWNGSSNTLWTNSLNWTPAGVPAASDNVTISGGTPNNPALWGDATVTNLTMLTGATLYVVDYTLTTTGNANITNSTINSMGGFYYCNGTTNVFNSSTVNVNLFVNGGTWNINNCIFNTPVTLTKTGGAGVITSGGNTYNNPVSIINNSTYTIRLGVTNPDIFNATSSFENQSTGTISLAYNSVNTIFNGDITITSLTSLGYMNFGIAGGTSTLNNGFTILEGPSGFLGGTLEIRNLNQLGSSVVHSLDLTISFCCSSTILVLKLGPGNTFNGNVNFSASNILLNGGTYNGPSYTRFIKTFNGSATSNISDGGNTFNSPDTYITNSTSSALTLSNINPDDYNGNAHFIKGISGSNIHVAYNAVNTFAANIEVAGSTFSPLPIQFGYGTGSVVLDGSVNQVISRLNPITVAPPSITRLTTNKPSGSTLLLNTSVNVLNSLTLIKGIFNTSAGNYMILNNGATTSIGAPISFIDGPMIYINGSTSPTTLNLPVGKGGIHRPAILNVTHADATQVSYTAEMMNASAMALGYLLPPTINLVSYVRYWQIDRQAINNLVSANVTLYYGPDDVVTDPNNLSIAKTIGAGTSWFDMGGTGTAPVSGSITSIPFNTFSKFTLSNDLGGSNPLPVELVSFTAIPDTRKVRLNWITESEVNCDHFTIERSIDAVQYEGLNIVAGSGNSNEEHLYNQIDNNPYLGTSYYRLKQTDFNGSYYYSEPVSVTLKESDNFQIQIYPNPSNGIFNIALDGIESNLIEIKINDMYGKICYDQFHTITQHLSSLQINGDTFPTPGIYSIQIISGKEAWTSKLIYAQTE